MQAAISEINLVLGASRPIEVTQVNQPNGDAAFYDGTGRLMSVQPSGMVEWRGVGSSVGAYERAAINGNIALFGPDGLWPFAYFSKLPNK